MMVSMGLIIVMPIAMGIMILSTHDTRSPTTKITKKITKKIFSSFERIYKIILTIAPLHGYQCTDHRILQKPWE